MYTLDTNVVLYYLKADVIVRAHFEEALSASLPLYVSTITEVELFAFSPLSMSEADAIDAVLGMCLRVAPDSVIAKQAAALMRMHGLKIADAVIAATALFTNSTLLTRNVRDFKRVPNLFLKAT